MWEKGPLERLEGRWKKGPSILVLKYRRYLNSHHHSHKKHDTYAVCVGVGNMPTNITKRKNGSIVDLVLRPKHKRSRVEAGVDRNMATKGEGASAKKTHSLEASRKKEVKARLNDEASKDIRPLAVGTLAMMASALSNQGR